jgi:WD40 repeat protein
VLAAAGADDTIRLWNLTAPEPRVTEALKGHKGDVRSVAFTTDGKTLASGDAGGIVLLWEMRAASCCSGI